MSEERNDNDNNVIPIPPRAVQFKADPSVKLQYKSIPVGDITKVSLAELVQRIEAREFQDHEDHPLTHAVEWRELIRRIQP